MTREESKYCEEISYDRLFNRYTIRCNERWRNIKTQSDAVIYCKRKKLKKEKKENVK